ncbi:unnamed protein product [Rhizophagus irregularis]|uniref:Uncharacterized protein n=1 Tax=Rhizophagus irregularis TaxID=588596 RepID=A0A915Z6G8_9GLOM|nr:unnamed protein product [Rhizophagus irregularis]
MEQKRIPNKEVALKFLSNSQNNDITNEFLNEIKSYFAEYDKIIKIYGISQSPATKDYIIVLQNDNLQYTTDEFLNEIKTYIDEKHTRDWAIESYRLFLNYENYRESRFNNIVKVYGISQTPDSKDYIMWK